MKKIKTVPKKPLSINEYLFCLIEEGRVLVWDYKSHNQYLMEKDYFIELLNTSKAISKQCEFLDEEILNEFIDSNLVEINTKKLKHWGWDPISKIFHFGTQNVGAGIEEKDPINFSKNYLEQCNLLTKMESPFFLERKGMSIDIPEPDLSLIENFSFLSSLKNRKTCRNFQYKNISFKELSLILYFSFGLIHDKWEDLRDSNLEYTGVRKASPSSGGLHSEEIYVVAYRIIGLTPGLYHYRSHDHKLTLLMEGNFEKKVIDMNYNQFFSEGMAFGIYITARFDKIWWKYKHSRAYRGILLDIGHLSQTFLLTSTALGLQTWITAAFHDKQIEDFLGIDTHKESVILFVGAGKGTNQSVPKIMLEQLKDNFKKNKKENNGKSNYSKSNLGNSKKKSYKN